jgi:hypothetical protein
MKLTTMVVAAMVAATTGALAAGAPAAGKVLICVNSDSYEFNPGSMVVLARAQDITSQMFKSAGVAVEWHSAGFGACRRPQQNQAVMLDFATNTPASQYPGALAYALPYEGVHIVLMVDRIQKKVADSAQVPPLLAHVMTHEITHILQGIARHSETGVMRACWDSQDFLQMTKGPLPFAPEDIALIERGMRQRAAGATPAAPSAATAELN